MRFADMEVWARRRLHDTGAQQRFTSGEIRSAINQGALQVQAAVQDVAPDAFEREYRTNIMTGERTYQLPRGFLRPKMVQLDLTGSGSLVDAEPTSLMRIRTARGSQQLDQGGYFYAISGGHLHLFPVPDTDVEDGFSIWYVPSLEMAEDDDDLETMGLVAPLHLAVVLWAVKLLLPEDAEPINEIEAEIGKLQARIPTLYSSYAGPEYFEVEGVPEKP